MTINPKTFILNVAILKGVPLDANDEELEKKIRL